MDIKLCELIGFFQLFFRNDYNVSIKRIGINWVSPTVPLSSVMDQEIYKVYKNDLVKSFGFCISDDKIHISV